MIRIVEMRVLIYSVTYLYVILINISMVLCDYTTYYLTYDSICGSGNFSKPLYLNYKNHAIIVELTQEYTSECEFLIKTSKISRLGIFAVIQKLNLRKSDVTGECIDYIQFRPSTETLKWGEKHCGNVNALEDVQSKQSLPSSFDFRNNSSNMLPYVFVSSVGEIYVKIHISFETIASRLDLKVAFTPYLEPSLWAGTFYMTCRGDMWIWKSYINDGIVNCPFESMNDETYCRYGLGGYIFCQNFCTRSVGRKYLHLPNDEYSAAIIKLKHTRDVIHDTPLNCEFTINTSSRKGIFAIISRMYLRKNSTTGECIDYVRFRRSSESYLNVSGISKEPQPWSKKNCGLDFNVEDECAVYSESSVPLSHTFIDPEGNIDVEVFIFDKISARERIPGVDIVFTSYTENPIDRKKFKQCSDQTWILSSYFSDEVLNCPFATCVDIAPCTPGDDDYINCHVFCKNGVRKIYVDLQNQRNAHSAVKLFLEFNHFVIDKWEFTCEFAFNAPPGMGAFAVIQKMQLRNYDVPGECVDYIRFRNSSRSRLNGSDVGIQPQPWSNKHCSLSFNPDHDCNPYSKRLTLVSPAFMNPEGSIDVKVFVSSYGYLFTPKAYIVFTSYTDNPIDRKEFKQCSDQTWIWNSYFKDDVLNCPFVSCADFTPCTSYDAGYLNCHVFCKNDVRRIYIDLQSQRNKLSAARVSPRLYNAVFDGKSLKCELTLKAPPGMGAFAVIQGMQLRDSPVTGECVDYVRFRRSSESRINVSNVSNEPQPWGKKLCGLDFKVKDECPMYSESSVPLSHAFINPEGKIDVEVFIFDKSSARERIPGVDIVFTSYTDNPIDRKKFQKCSDQTWIWDQYFGDEVLNCPFATCVDNAPCARSDDDYLNCHVPCKNGFRARYIDLQNQRSTYSAVRLLLHFNDTVTDEKPLKCEFTFSAPPGMGAFAVIQGMQLRDSDVPGECIDYIRFRNSSRSRLNGSDVGLQQRPWSNKHCSLSFNPDHDCNFYSKGLTLLSHAFMNPEGMIDVEVFISSESTDELPSASIVFTSYTENPEDPEKFKQCSDRTWIRNSYFKDAVLNCPFATCADFTPCTSNDDGYLKCNDLCASNDVTKKIHFNENVNSAVIVELDHLNLIEKRPRRCKFEINASPGMGVFAVIQTMELRRNNVTGECVDYVEFQHFSNEYKPGEKRCGVINVLDNDCTFSDTKHSLNMLPHAFVYPNGKVRVKIFVSDENISPGIASHFRIVFTGYLPIDEQFKNSNYEKCNANTQIRKLYYRDEKVNCPFVSCADEAVCRSDDDGYTKCENICLSSIREKNIKLYENETSAAIVQLHYPNSSTIMNPRGCEFSVKASRGMGVFAVIQKLNLRINETTDECIDYVQFRHSGVLHLGGNNATVSLPWSDPYCGDINGSMITSSSSDSINTSNVLSRAFIDPEGEISVKMHIANQSISSRVKLYLKIAFTAYKVYTFNVTDYTMCSNETYIKSTYYNDTVLNCPFITCADELGRCDSSNTTLTNNTKTSDGTETKLTPKGPATFDLLDGENATKIIALILVILILLITTIYYFVNKNQKENDALKTWIKKIVIEKQIDLEDDVLDSLRMPIVTIQRIHVGRVTQGEISQDYEMPLFQEWEFPRENLTLERVLGEGEFGKVFQAKATGISEEGEVTTVAVKTLKDKYNDGDMVSLVSEMEMMKLIGKHVNILTLLGCCSQGGPLFVITEVAERGNLQEFLRSLPQNVDRITQKTLIGYAVQIAEGMKYLASIRCVHRDLAARNILITRDNIMKIADFGLAKDVRGTYYYKKKNSEAKLPIRWMAPETIFRNRFTTKSDVWSYGVLLWEIQTLGGIPYPLYNDMKKLCQQIARGYRMEKPENCSMRIYKIMRMCWNQEPQDRPEFSTLIDLLNEVSTDFEVNSEEQEASCSANPTDDSGELDPLME